MNIQSQSLINCHLDRLVPGELNHLSFNDRWTIVPRQLIQVFFLEKKIEDHAK